MGPTNRTQPRCLIRLDQTVKVFKTFTVSSSNP
jgi:hypothetical protein